MSESKRKPNVSAEKFVEVCMSAKSFGEVAKILGVSENNVRARHKSYNEKLTAVGAATLPTYVATRGGNRVDIAALAALVAKNAKPADAVAE